MTWEGVYTVCGYKADSILAIDMVVVLDHENGHFMELYACWLGFDQAVDAMTKRLSGIAPNWLEQVKYLEVGDQPLPVWQRP